MRHLYRLKHEHVLCCGRPHYRAVMLILALMMKWKTDKYQGKCLCIRFEQQSGFRDFFVSLIFLNFFFQVVLI